MSIDTLLLALIIVGILQGMLEWLPVSSEAFVLMVLLIFNVPAHIALIIAILLHLPTGLAAIVYYRQDFIKIIKDIFTLRRTNITSFAIVGTLMTAVTAIPLYFLLKKFLAHLEATIHFASLIVFLLIGIAMISTGFSTSKMLDKNTLRSLEHIKISDSAIVGILQGFAIIPGVSRSGITIATLAWMGFDQQSSLKGSFILGGIVSIMSFLFLALTEDLQFTVVSPAYFFLPMIIAFFVSLASIDYLMRLARRISYPRFLKVIGTIIIILSVLGILILLCI